MKTFFKCLVIFLLVVIGLFIAGPVPEDKIHVTFDAKLIPDDMETYLAESEAKVPNLIEGAEKEIIWADAKAKTEYAIIYIHGFSATKYETRPVPDKVAEAMGANLFLTRMQGHGRDGDGLAEGTISGWINDFHEAVTIGKRLGEKVIIMATSNGAPIATWGLQDFQNDPAIVGLVTISANYELQGVSTTLANIPWAETILPLVGGKNRSWEPSNELHGKWWTNAYPSRAIFPMTALLKRVKDIDKQTLKTPTLFIYSPEDRVIKSEEIEKVASEWGGPVETYKVQDTSDEFKHVIAGDILSPENTNSVTNRIVKWIKAL